MNRAILLLVLPALLLAACAGVPKPRDGNMGVLMFKPVFDENVYSNVTTTPNGMQWGTSARTEMEITLSSISTGEVIVRSIASSGKIFSIYNIPAGLYRVAGISLIRISNTY